MSFFVSLRKSLYDVHYYHQEGQAYTFGKALWRYMRIFFLVFFILGTIGMFIFAHFFTKENISRITTTAKGIALQAYPSGLVLDISAESGVSTNSTGPIIFSKTSLEAILSGQKIMGMMGKENNLEHGKRKKEVTINGSSYNTNELEKYENILVIDTQASGDIRSYNTLALLTKNQLIIQAKENEKRVYEVSETMQGKPPVHITQESAVNSLEGLSTTIINNAGKITGTVYAMVAAIGLLVLIFISFLVGLFTAIVLYFYAIIVWIISKVLGTNYEYKQIYSMSVIGFTLPFLLIPASSLTKLIILCVIVGRVLYLHKKNTKEDHKEVEKIS